MVFQFGSCIDCRSRGCSSSFATTVVLSGCERGSLELFCSSLFDAPSAGTSSPAIASPGIQPSSLGCVQVARVVEQHVVRTIAILPLRPRAFGRSRRGIRVERGILQLSGGVFIYRERGGSTITRISRCVVLRVTPILPGTVTWGRGDRRFVFLAWVADDGCRAMRSQLSLKLFSSRGGNVRSPLRPFLGVRRRSPFVC